MQIQLIHSAVGLCRGSGDHSLEKTKHYLLTLSAGACLSGSILSRDLKLNTYIRQMAKEGGEGRSREMSSQALVLEDLVKMQVPIP